jgi:hypothetical protein
LVQILVISVVLLSISMIGLAFNILFRKNGRFPSYEVGRNKEMRKLGITCVKHDEYKCFANLKNNTVDCSACGALFDEEE